jgi:hypothetical protein
MTSNFDRETDVRSFSSIDYILINCFCANHYLLHLSSYKMRFMERINREYGHVTQIRFFLIPQSHLFLTLEFIAIDSSK